jgi:hypothetical protein
MQGHKFKKGQNAMHMMTAMRHCGLIHQQSLGAAGEAQLNKLSNIWLGVLHENFCQLQFTAKNQK